MVEGSTRGRANHWFTVAVVIFGFTLGCLGLIFSSWVLFIVGAVIAVGGGIFGMATGIMENVE